MMKHLISGLALLWLCYLPQAWAQTVVATLDRNTITTEETLNLTIRSNGRDSAASPDLSDLEKNFRVLSQGRKNQFRSYNGQVEAWVEWSITLAPKQQGRLFIPSFNVGGEFTKPIEVTVKKAEPVNLAAGQTKDIFLLTEISEKEVFVQQQVLLTLRLHTALPVSGISRDDLIIDNAKLEQVAEQRYNRTINGRDYAVVELVFALYPQESGELTVPEMSWEAQIGARSNSLFDLYSRQNNVRVLRSQAETITVKPRPDSDSSPYWLPAKDMVIAETWSDDFPNFVQGEPITRSISLVATGLTGSQLPELDFDYPSAINNYPEPSQVNEQKSATGIITTSSQVQALVATKPGRYTLPAVTVQWWDTEKNQPALAELPAREITVQAAANAGSAPPELTGLPSTTADTPGSPNTPEADLGSGQESTSQITWLLLIVSNICTALVVAIIALGWQARRKSSAPTVNIEKRHSTAMPRLTAAVAHRNNAAIHSALLQLCREYNPGQRPSLEALINQINNTQAKQAIRDLDAALFANGNSVNINYPAILSGCQSLSRPSSEQPEATLAPLNPA